MARPPRIEYPGALYHLTSRGNAQEDTFRDDADREAFLAVVERFGWRLYALWRNCTCGSLALNADGDARAWRRLPLDGINMLVFPLPQKKWGKIPLSLLSTTVSGFSAQI